MGRGERVVLGQHEEAVAPERAGRIDHPQLDADVAGEDRAEREDNERRCHHLGRFMDVRHHLLVGARRAVEGHQDQPPAIEGREQRGDDA